MAEIGYCPKCKDKREIKDGQVVVFKNKRRVWKGVCIECGTSMSRVLGKASPSVGEVGTAQPGEEATKAPKAKKKGLCVKAGKLAGKLTRGVYPICQRVAKVGAAAYQTVVKKGEQVVKGVFSVCAGHSRVKGIRRYEKKQRRVFARLGAEIFQLNKEKAEDIWGQSKVNELIGELAEAEQHLQEIRQATEAEGFEKGNEAIYKRALADLKNAASRKRLNAIRVLEKLGKKQGIVYLSEVLKDTDEAIRMRAAVAINRLTRITSTTAEKVSKKDEVGLEPKPGAAPG